MEKRRSSGCVGRADLDRQTVGANGRRRSLSDQGRPAGRGWLRPSLADHVRPAQPTAGSAGAAARGALPADADGAGDARRGEGAGMAQGRAEGGGGAGRRWPWGRKGVFRLPRWVRRHGPVSVEHVVEWGCSAMPTGAESITAYSLSSRHSALRRRQRDGLHPVPDRMAANASSAYPASFRSAASCVLGPGLSRPMCGCFFFSQIRRTANCSTLARRPQQTCRDIDLPRGTNV